MGGVLAERALGGAVLPREHRPAACAAPASAALVGVHVRVRAALRHVAVGGKQTLAPPLTPRGVEARPVAHTVALVAGIAAESASRRPVAASAQRLQPAEGAAFAVTKLIGVSPESKTVWNAKDLYDAER